MQRRELLEVEGFPKVAMLFLTIDSIHHERAWRAFLNEAGSLVPGGQTQSACNPLRDWLLLFVQCVLIYRQTTLMCLL